MNIDPTEFLAGLHEFQNDRQLRAVFVDGRIESVKAGLPEAGSPLERVTLLIPYLASACKLDAFLFVLSERYVAEQGECQAILSLIGNLVDGRHADSRKTKNAGISLNAGRDISVSGDVAVSKG